MLYLAWTQSELEELDAGPWEDVFVLAPGLLVVDSPSSRSQVYHALKRELPAGRALLVAEMHEPPKAKGLAPGAMTWLRSHRFER